MFVVPIKNDMIITRDKQVLRVLSYAPYRASPSVFVEQDGPEPLAISFNDIVAINKTPVKLGGVFQTAGAFSRKVHLPQKDDVLTIGREELRLRGYKLLKTKLSEGLQVHGLDKNGEPKTLPLKLITSINPASGTSPSVRSLLSTYSEYLGVQ